MRAVKLIKLLRLSAYVSQVEAVVGRAVLRILMFLVGSIFMTHISACVFHFVALVDNGNHRTWINSGILADSSRFDR